MRYRPLLFLALVLILGSAANSAASPAVSAQDRTFVMTAGHAGAAEISAAKLAMSKTTNPSTIAFAKRMIRDHTSLAAKLKAVAASVGLAPPATPTMTQSASIKALGKLNGAAFEAKYRQSQISAHQAAIKLFTGETEHGQAAKLKAAATAALPTLKMHLNMAENMSA